MAKPGITIARLICRFTAWLTIRLEVEGVEKLPSSGSCVVIANHLGRLDGILVYASLNRTDIILLLAEKYRKYVFFRLASRLIDAIWVDRHNADFQAMRAVLRRLEQGEMLVIAPEGTRSTTKALLQGKPGASYIAAKAGAPIYPAGVTGTEDTIIKANIKRLKRSYVKLRIGKPFTLPALIPGDREAQVEQGTEEMMCQIAALLPPAYRGVYADHPRVAELLASQNH